MATMSLHAVGAVSLQVLHGAVALAVPQYAVGHVQQASMLALACVYAMHMWHVVTVALLDMKFNVQATSKKCTLRRLAFWTLPQKLKQLLCDAASKWLVSTEEWCVMLRMNDASFAM